MKATEAMIFWLLKNSSKEERLRIINEMVFQLLPAYHLHNNPKKKKTQHHPFSSAPPLVSAEVMAHFDNLVAGIKEIKNG